MRLGERVLNLLVEKGRRGSELAEFLGTRQTTVTGWKQENRNPSSELVLPLCRFFGISPNELFTYIDPHWAKLSDEEARLLDLYRATDADGRAIILADALKESRGATQPSNTP